jgi:hypothetical protein
MKLTSQMPSSTSLIPTFCPANHGRDIDALAMHPDATAGGDEDVAAAFAGVGAAVSLLRLSTPRTSARVGSGNPDRSHPTARADPAADDSERERTSAAPQFESVGVSDLLLTRGEDP